MFKLGVSLVFLSVLAVQVTSDQIDVSALTQIFKYATPASVKTLTTNLNKQKTEPKSLAVLKAWIPKNFKSKTAKLIASDPYSKQAYATTKANAFIKYRYSLEKYINYLYTQAVKSKYLTVAEANNMKTLFWDADAKTNNNFTATCAEIEAKANSAIVKTPPLITEIRKDAAAFAKANPADYKNLQWTL